ncbi:MAG: VOC family protein [Myxococcota bacterium]|nr:VOC family protein [Myxococcota bacterium]
MSTMISDSNNQDAVCRLGQLDHYTLIVDNAESVARFHTDMLGFELMDVRPLNTGTAASGDFDMLNYIMRFPDDSDRTLVITEGLTDDSIFRRQLRSHGPGIHHLAYQVEDIDGAVVALQSAGVRLLSDEIIRDVRSGLRQIFVEIPGAGYTLELIERTAKLSAKTFDDNNMVGLAMSMTGDTPTGEGDREGCSVERLYSSSERAIRAWLSDPGRLGAWTGHRTVREVGGHWREIRWYGDAEVVCESEANLVRYTWRTDDGTRSFIFGIHPQGEGCRVSVVRPDYLPLDEWDRLARILRAELELLAHCLGEQVDSSTLRLAQKLVDDHALAIVQRGGLGGSRSLGIDALHDGLQAIRATAG